jgi:serine/threonine-protein phosphatase 2A activator
MLTKPGPAIDPTLNPPKPTPTEGSLPRSPSPSKVADKGSVENYKDSNMYFSAIQFIYDVKRGPFWEHSPVLYDVSGIKDGWGKINKGMLKMYAAEVLGKFPVVQHFPCGSLFRWEPDPVAVSQGTTVHAAQQPKAGAGVAPSQAQPSSASGAVGTKAPWASTPAVGNLPAGVPTTRAPWAATQRPSAPSAQASGEVRTTAPWRNTPTGMPPPNTRRNGG